MLKLRRKNFYKILKHLDELDTLYDDGLHMYYINAAIGDGSAIAGLMKYFKTADANDRSQGNLSKRINTIKTQKEGSTFMDELLKEALNIGKAEGKAEGKFEATLNNLKNIMESLNMPIDKAMDILKTPPEERQLYKDLLAKGL